MEGEEEGRVLEKGSRKESLASPISTGRRSVGEEPPAEGDEYRGTVPRPPPGVFACALKNDS